MAESALTLDLAALRIIAIEELHGGDPTAYASLTSEQQARVDRFINDGLRQFYDAHDWTFLKPYTTLELNAAYSTGTVTIASGVVTLAGGTFPSWAAAGMLRIDGVDYSVNTRDSDTQLTLDDTTLDAAAGTTFELHQDDYDLPDDVERVIGDMHFPQAANAWRPVCKVSVERIEELRQRNPVHIATGEPYYVAIVPVANDATAGTRIQACFWPNIVEANTVRYRYEVRPTELSTTNKYPWGASDHSQTIKASLLSVIEMWDQKQRGIWWDNYQQCLQRSIFADGRNNRADHLGYHGNGPKSIYGRREYLRSNSVTYRGTGSQ